MDISIFASIWSQNLWDELILKNEILLLEEAYSEFYRVPKSTLHFNVFSYDTKHIFFEKENVKYYEYFPIAIKNIKNVTRNIKNFSETIKIIRSSDIIVIWWWGIFYDTEHQSVWSPLKQWMWRSKVLKFFKKRVEFFRVGIDIKNDKNNKYIDEIFSCASKISVRDGQSYDLLYNLGYWDILSLEKDPVFSNKKKYRVRKMALTIEKPVTKNTSFQVYIDSKKLSSFWSILKSHSINFNGKRVGVSMRSLPIDWYEADLIDILSQIIEKGWDLIFIPHSFHASDTLANDFIFLEKIKIFLEKKFNKQFFIASNLEESYETYTQKKIDINLAQRLHAIILSYTYEINFIAISYSKKTDEILNQMRKEEMNI